MAISKELHYAKLDDLYLDPLNPRLGRNNTGPNKPQDEVLDLMKDWTLDELATSFVVGGGYWTHEALLVSKEKVYGKERLVVIEGNRRLAALKLLKMAYDGKPITKKWAEIAKTAAPTNLFTKIPYLEITDRKDVQAFLGFRHVTGIKEWRPAEKAEFIAKMIDEGMSYDEVRRKIGSKTPTVRENYISYRLLLQIENNDEIPQQNFEERFSVMYISLKTQGAQKYLQIDIQASPREAKRPVPKSHLKNLKNFALWLFGDEKRSPLFTDSRDVDKFGRILESKDATKYLERTDRPNFEFAFNLAGGDEPEIVDLIEGASDNIEFALTRVHLHKKSKKIRDAIKRFREDSEQILKIFPDIQ